MALLRAWDSLIELIRKGIRDIKHHLHRPPPIFRTIPPSASRINSFRQREKRRNYGRI
jgi:hypothetical protein